MASENFSLKWNDFEKNISSGLRDIRSSGDFLDVTLVCEQEQVQAHKLVLSTCSTFFRNILTRNPSPNPLIYLRGVSYADMTAVLNFMYHGEVNVAQEDLNTFLAIAEDLKVKGLTQHDTVKETSQEIADNGEKSERSSTSADSPSVDRKRSIKRPTEAPLQKKPRDADAHDNDVVHIKSEPTFAAAESPSNAISIAEVSYGRDSSRAMVKPGEEGLREDGLDIEDGLDREDGLDSHLDYSYEDYHQVSYGEGSQMSTDSLSKELVKTEEEVSRLVARRQDGSFQCNACGKTSNKVTNIKNHIEAHHTSTTGYTCGLCNKFCRTKNSYHVHMSTKHRTNHKQMPHFQDQQHY